MHFVCLYSRVLASALISYCQYFTILWQSRSDRVNQWSHAKQLNGAEITPIRHELMKFDELLTSWTFCHIWKFIRERRKITFYRKFNRAGNDFFTMVIGFFSRVLKQHSQIVYQLGTLNDHFSQSYYHDVKPFMMIITNSILYVSLVFS